MYNKFFLYCFTLLIVVFLFSCTCNCVKENPTQQTESVTYKNYPEGSYFEIPNKSGSHLLLIEKSGGKSKAINHTKFYLFDKQKDEIVLEDFIPLGKVEWESDTLLRVEKYPGNIQKDQTKVSGYLYDINTHDKKPL